MGYAQRVQGLHGCISSNQGILGHMSALQTLCLAYVHMLAVGSPSGRGGGPGRRPSGPPRRRTGPGGMRPQQGGDRVKPPPSTLYYYALYKPFNVLCQFSPEGQKRTLKDILPDVSSDVYPVSDSLSNQMNAAYTKTCGPIVTRLPSYHSMTEVSLLYCRWVVLITTRRVFCCSVTMLR